MTDTSKSYSRYGFEFKGRTVSFVVDGRLQTFKISPSDNIHYAHKFGSVYYGDICSDGESLCPCNHCILANQQRKLKCCWNYQFINEGIAKSCIVMDFCEPCDECGGGKIVTKHATVALFIEALNTKDREALVLRDEAVAEAVRSNKDMIARHIREWSTFAYTDSEFKRLVLEYVRDILLTTPQEVTTISEYGTDECFCMWFKCSNCGGTMITDESKYCPDCGARITNTPQGLQDNSKDNDTDTK